MRKPGSTKNYVLNLIHKEQAGTYDDAMTVLQHLADDLNKLADEQKAAA